MATSKLHRHHRENRILTRSANARKGPAALAVAAPRTRLAMAGQNGRTRRCADTLSIRMRTRCFCLAQGSYGLTERRSATACASRGEACLMRCFRGCISSETCAAKAHRRCHSASRGVASGQVSRVGERIAFLHGMRRGCTNLSMTGRRETPNFGDKLDDLW